MQKDKVNAKTVHRYHANIRKALQRAVKPDIIPANPADKVDLPKVKKFRGSYYTPEELQRLFACTKGTKFETVVLLAGYLGVRGAKRAACDGKTLILRKTSFAFVCHLRCTTSTRICIMVKPKRNPAIELSRFHKILRFTCVISRRNSLNSECWAGRVITGSGMVLCA